MNSYSQNDCKSQPSELPVGRFAPSPTGPLHFGSLVAAIGSYCLAKKAGGRWLLRIEDLDAPRVVPGAADTILRTLESLGLEWDAEIVWQSQRSEVYEEALRSLVEQGLVYGCACSRKEILSSAPHRGEEGPVYPGTCRQGLPAGRVPRALRLRVPSNSISFRDQIFGSVEQSLDSAVGDFVLRRADGVYAYQLAVVVDDAESGVTQVVRGEDLLPSTPRQIYLHGCLGTPVPQYFHLPLVLSPEGEKLSKRHGAVCPDHPAVVWRALRFLGQKVPTELKGADPKQVLLWGVSCFDEKQVPSGPSPVALD